jgi:long-subunit fatty acid transport protein
MVGFRGRHSGSAAASWLWAAALVVIAPSLAHAAGVEDTVGGTKALGRAANYVAVNDFMATWQNPANLAVIPGNDVGLELRLPVFGACFDRAKPDGTHKIREPGAAPGYQGSESFGQVCNKAAPALAGNLGFARAQKKNWGWGVGIFTPAGIGNLKMGSDTIVTVPTGGVTEKYPITATGTESPNRAMLIQREVLSAFLMAGIGYQPLKLIRFGVSAGVGFASVHYKNVVSLDGKDYTTIDQEALADVHVSDFAIPRATASVVLTPTEGLELMAQLTYAGDIKAKGHVDLTANGIKGQPRANCRDASPGTHCRVDDAKLNAPYQPIELTLGGRFASRRNPFQRTIDPMKDERWDIEVDAFYAQTSHIKTYQLDLYDPSDANKPRIQFTSATGNGAAPAPLPSRAAIPHQWRDTFGARLGGDYNFIRQKLSGRLGLSYQSSAIPTSYMNIDYWAVQKIGLHAGGTVAFGKFKLSLAYSHVFQQKVTVGVGDGKVQEVAAVNGSYAQSVNEGRFISAIDIFSLQGNYVF